MDNSYKPLPVRNNKNSGEIQKPIKLVACGAYFVVIVTIDDEIYACGENSYGQLTIPSSTCPYSSLMTRIEIPVECPKALKIMNVKCGHSFTYFICEYMGDNVLFACGRNYDCQLSLPQNISVPRPTMVTSKEILNKKIRLFECGHSFAICVTSENQIFAVGENRFQQCGRPIAMPEFTHVDLTSVIGKGEITHLACGYFHTTLAVDEKKVYAFGMNRNGQFGNNLESERAHSCTLIFESPPGQKIAKLASGARFITIVTSGGEIYTAGNVPQGFQRMVEIEKFINERSSVASITHLTCGESHTILVCEKKRVFVSGSNRFGQLGISGQITNTTVSELDLDQSYIRLTNENHIQHIDCGDYFTFFCLSYKSFGLMMHKILLREDKPLSDVTFCF
ncbi:retinitis pigmentosa GTPase regulator [Naegleria gruberi]|uniref:Retinitis pigmentosa GTPase regulator n=1 Tax=Naegleria gruberi TaxID=5762 RepID=D2VK13_NAEGR|nr:retinitis pigmentosa GTPase regulator [Naegleria gruberi]EFC42868.1 retinitis pigmentosa GTPase regulator [Naegleria gruberi]|eukprot:XP_002675612.1 retinitis pigmentosa GTPase regulator [Naegleria gruberi strain NEG-M]